MLTYELTEAIDRIEAAVVKKLMRVEMSSHRWEQVLRILKFYRLKEKELMRDPLWDGDQSNPDSPYFHKGRTAQELAASHRSYLLRAKR